MSSKKRVSYTEKDKKKYISEFNDLKSNRPELTIQEFADQHNLKRQTLSKWIHNSESYDENSQNYKKRDGLHAAMESSVHQWFCNYKNQGGIVTNDMLLCKFQQIYNEENPGNIKADGTFVYSINPTLIHRFKKRFDLVSRRCYGELKDSDWEAARNFKWKSLHDDFSDWSDDEWKYLVNQGRLWNIDCVGTIRVSHF